MIFQAQTPMELSLVKGEMVTLTRRIDGNWLVCYYIKVLIDSYIIVFEPNCIYLMSNKLSFDIRYEGRIGARRGIFPATYVDVSVEPGEATSTLGLFDLIKIVQLYYDTMKFSK